MSRSTDRGYVDGLGSPDRDPLSAEFGRLRSGREGAARSFVEAVGAGRVRVARRRSRARRRLLVAFVVVTPVAAAAAAHARERASVRASIALAEEVGELVEWRSPTGPLLHDPYSDWMSDGISLHASEIPIPSQNRGDP